MEISKFLCSFESLAALFRRFSLLIAALTLLHYGAVDAHAGCASTASYCATDGNFTDKIQVSWNDSQNYFEYVLYRATGDVNCTPTTPGCSGWTQEYQTFNEVATYNDTEVSSATLYSYWLCFRPSSTGTLVCPQTGPAGLRKVNGWRGPPPSPSNLSTSDGTSTSHIQLLWSYVNPALEPTTFTIYRAENPHSCASGGSILASGVNSNSFNDTSAIPGRTYYYSLQTVATNGGSTSSCLTEGQGGWRKMSPPTNLTAVAQDGDTVQVSWSHPVIQPSNGVIQYRVYRHTSNSACTNGQHIASVDASSAVYVNNDLLPGVYYYGIRTQGQNGALSDCIAGSPSSVTVSGFSISGSTRKDSVGGAPLSGVVIRKNGSVVMTTGSSGTFTVTGLANGSYTISAEKSGVSFPSSPQSIQISGQNVSNVIFVGECPAGQAFSGDTCAPIPPGAPLSLQATDGIFTNRVEVTWFPASGTVSSYQVYRQANCSGSSIGTVAGTNFSDFNVTPGTIYNYSAKAFNGATAGACSNTDQGSAAVTPPGSPTGLSASDGTSTSGIQVSWNAPVTGGSVQNYEIFQSASCSGAPFQSVSSGTTSIMDSSPSAGIDTIYSVRAVNSAGAGTCSSSDSGYRAMGAVQGVQVAPLPSNSAEVSWSSLPGATLYRIFQSANCTGTFVTSAAPATTVSNLQLDTSHSFSVKAAGQNGQFGSATPCSNSASVTLASATIAVQASTAQGDPVSDAEVFLNGQLRGSTNSSGALVAGGLSPGNYVVTIARANTSFSPPQHSATLNYGSSESRSFVASCNEGFEPNQGQCDPIPAEPIALFAECVSDLGAGNFRAYFGYDNPNPVLEIPVGNSGASQNFFSPGELSRGQVTTFQTGRVKGAFSVEFDGAPLTWNVEYSGQGVQSVTVDSATPACASVTPQANCISISPQGDILAHFGYQNPNDFVTPIILPIGEKNKFVPAPENRGQPTEFLAGTVVNAFEVVVGQQPLEWVLSGQSATASLSTEVCAPGNNAPVAFAGGPYTAACQGSLTNIQLSATASLDPDQNPLRYSWSTTCGEASLSDSSSAQPILTLLRPGLGQSVSCEVTLEVTDGLLTDSSSADISVAACNLDCLGNPNGSAQIDVCGVCGGDGTSCLDCAGTPFGTLVTDQCGMCGGANSCLDCTGTPNGTAGPDRCGVCGGDGTSCLGCVETNLSELITFLTRDFFTLRDINARALRRLKGAALPGYPAVAKQAVRELKKIDFRYKEFQIDLFANLPPTVVSCSNDALCVQKDNSAILDKYSVLADDLLKGTKRAVTRVKKITYLTRTDKKRVVRAGKVNGIVKQNLLAIPRVVSSCR